ncbi:hypothetical protein E1B28_013464 [Marasmius oreades]|uniref:Uncharacterized protein n=1 Tax=Marasmius oreades TaxID=181124 RepID=A0A9P7RQG2_9AGAR|nr:uncharacterized protein E1B28_013464 [Marasmius oreades]KAG7087503.1 hypothetical protein E1B28_013464 [Marasmius oreades]
MECPQSELDSVNDDKPVKEYKVPDQSKLSTEEYEQALKQYEIYKHNVDTRRRMRFIPFKDMKNDPSNPFLSILGELSGKPTVPKPHQKTAMTTWAACNKEHVSKLFEKEKEKKRPVRGQIPKLWQDCIRVQWEKLSEEDKEGCDATAKVKHAQELKEWKASQEATVSNTPEDLQQAIHMLPQFIKPILEGIQDVQDGYVHSLAWVQLEPKDDGHINIMRYVLTSSNMYFSDAQYQ